MSEPTLKLVQDEPAESAPPSGRWITAKDAAARSGLNLGTINRSCLESWSHTGLAKRGALPSGQQGWWIDESADPRFVLGKNADDKDKIFDAAKLGLTEAQTQEVLRRRKIVADWNDLVRASAAVGLSERQVTDTYLKSLTDRGQKISRATLYNWLSGWRHSGLEGLIDARWKCQRESDDYAQFMASATQLFLDTRRRSLTVCYEISRQLASENGWPIPSYGHCHRLIKRIDPAVVSLKRDGEKAFVDEHEPSLDRDYSSIAANDWWCSDDHPCDVWVRHGTKPNGEPIHIRPILHAWQDLRSRKILAWELCVEAPTTQVILRTFVRSAKEFGVPRVAYVDNGKTFDSRIMQGISKKQRLSGVDVAKTDGAFVQLGVTTKHAWPFHGQSKPIERWFGVMENRFGKLWDTYAGKDTKSKPDDLKKKLAAGAAPTLEEYASALAEWIETDHNAKAGHLGDSMDEKSPNVVYAETLVTRRTLPVELLEFATFETYCPQRKLPDGKIVRGVLVGQHGVTYQGLQFGQFNQEVIRLHGKRVKLKVDDRDLRHVYICDLEGRFITVAQANGKIAFALPGSIDNAVVRDAIGEKKRIRKVIAQAHADRPKAALDIPDLALRAYRQKAAQSPPTPPIEASLQPVRTAFDDQLPAIQAAMPGTSAARQKAEQLAALDDLRPTTLRIAGADEADEDDVFGSLTDAMKNVRAG